MAHGRFIPRIRRYPVWSARMLGLLALLDIALITVLVFAIGRKPLFVETEISLAIIAATLFVFLAVGLYRGARVRRESLEIPALSSGSSGEKSRWADLLDGGWDLPGTELLDADEGCLGAIVSVVLSILVMIALAIVFWLLVNFLWGAFAVLLLALFWVFNRALRVVFAWSRRCRGRLGLSIAVAFAYTVAYTGWLIALVWLVARIRKA